MPAPDCCLTLILPHALRERVVDLMLSHRALAAGFACVPVDGYGRNAVYATTAEQVRGAVRRVQIQAVMDEDDALLLIADLREQLGDAGIHYWLAPLIACGSLSS